MFLRLTLDLPEDILSRALLQDINVVKDDIDDIESIVGELCSNVIRHAHSIKARFSVVIEYAERRAIILVEDEGTGFVAKDVAAPGSERSGSDGRTRVGGYGLALVAGMADKLTFSVTYPHGTTVRVEKQLHYGGVPLKNEPAMREAKMAVMVTAVID
jgi:anti-sigma regulatory factor (Ser/Thr protein kinase)